KMALLASDEVMIPVAPAYLDANGLVNMIKRVHEIRDAWGRQNPLVTGVVIVKLSSRVNGHKEIHREIKTNPVLGKMYMGYVPINSEIEYAQAAQESVFTYNVNSSSAQAYADVTRHIAQHLFAKQV
ncbi:MAG: ParA family protein, partial [Chloroflexota bacterium]